ADAHGNVAVAWHASDGVHRGEASRRLWVAQSSDDGRTFAREVPASPEAAGACGCCAARAFAEPGGMLFVLYRAAAQGVDRDMTLVTARAPGAPFQADVVDRWKINSCPMSSESLAAGAGAIWGAWETNGQVYFARIDSRTLKPGPRIPAPGPGQGRKHPALAVNRSGEVLLAWTEGTGWQRGGDLAWQRFYASGQPLGEMGRMPGAIPLWGLATVLARPDGGFEIIR